MKAQSYEYRIVTNGHAFKVQQRGCFWAWHDVHSVADVSGVRYQFVPFFDTLDEARAWIDRQEWLEV